MEDYFSLHLPEDEVRAISSIGLAHLGDAVYELLARSYLCVHGKATGKGLHRAAVELVRAQAQAERAERILPMLTEEELTVFKRGRNAHVNTIPHSASRGLPPGHGAGVPFGIPVFTRPAGADQPALRRHDGGGRPCHLTPSA